MARRDGDKTKVLGKLGELLGLICVVLLGKSLRTSVMANCTGQLKVSQVSLKYHPTTFPLGQFSHFKMFLLNSSFRNFALMRHCKKITFSTLA